MSSNASRKRAAGATVPTHLKYPKYDAVGAAQLVEDRKVRVQHRSYCRRVPVVGVCADMLFVPQKPSQMMLELQDGPVKPAKFAPPQIIEFQNLEDNSANVNSVVDVDERANSLLSITLSVYDQDLDSSKERVVTKKGSIILRLSLQQRAFWRRLWLSPASPASHHRWSYGCG